MLQCSEARNGRATFFSRLSSVQGLSTFFPFEMCNFIICSCDLIWLGKVYVCVCSILFGTVFFLNCFLWAKHSSAAVPFLTLVAILALWFGVSVPLTFVGAYFGFRRRVRHKLQPHPFFTHIYSELSCCFAVSSQLSIQFEPIRSRDRFPSSPSTRAPFPESSWAASSRSAASSSNSSSSSTVSGQSKHRCIHSIVFIVRVSLCV